MPGPNIDGLTANVDATFADDEADATVKQHQVDHDIAHAMARAVTYRTATGSETLTAADAGKLVRVDSGSNVTITVPPQSSDAWPDGAWVAFRQVGAGQVLWAAGAGVTIHFRGAVDRTAGQWAEAVVSRDAADVWVVSGDLA